MSMCVDYDITVIFVMAISNLFFYPSIIFLVYKENFRANSQIILFVPPS